MVESPVLVISGESVSAVMILMAVVAISLRSKSIISGRMPIFSCLDSANEYPSPLEEVGRSKSFTLLEVGLTLVSGLLSGASRDERVGSQSLFDGGSLSLPEQTTGMGSCFISSDFSSYRS